MRQRLAQTSSHGCSVFVSFVLVPRAPNTVYTFINLLYFLEVPNENASDMITTHLLHPVVCEMIVPNLSANVRQFLFDPSKFQITSCDAS